MSNESGRVAVVTGGSSGIGLAAARQLAERGWKLVLASRNPEQLDRAGASLDGDWIGVPTDVSDPKAVAAMIDRATDHFGRLDALVNNAGYAPLLPIDQTNPETINKVFAINSLGTAYAIARAWPIFEGQRSGVIVNVSTIGTTDPFHGFFAYAAAKAAVEVMVKSCASEGKRYGIRAFAVAPGAVETPMLRSIFDQKMIPQEKTLEPDDVARVIVECLEGERDGDNGKTILVPSP